MDYKTANELQAVIDSLVEVQRAKREMILAQAEARKAKRELDLRQRQSTKRRAARKRRGPTPQRKLKLRSYKEWNN